MEWLCASSSSREQDLSQTSTQFDEINGRLDKVSGELLLLNSRNQAALTDPTRKVDVEIETAGQTTHGSDPDSLYSGGDDARMSSISALQHSSRPSSSFLLSKHFNDDIAIMETSNSTHRSSSVDSFKCFSKLEDRVFRGYRCCGLDFESLHNLSTHHDNMHPSHRCITPANTLEMQRGDPNKDNAKRQSESGHLSTLAETVDKFSMSDLSLPTLTIDRGDEACGNSTNTTDGFLSPPGTEPQRPCKVSHGSEYSGCYGDMEGPWYNHSENFSCNSGLALTSNVDLPSSSSTHTDNALSKASQFAPFSHDQTNARKHVCDTCSAAFQRRSTLQTHLRTHSDQKQSPCTVAGCTTILKQDGERSRHIKYMHTDEKRFVCGPELPTDTQWGCGKRFRRKDGLNEHHFKTEKGRACYRNRPSRADVP